MPGKRHKGKSKFGFWLPDYERDLLKRLAADAGLNQTEMIQEMLHAYAQVRGIKIDVSEVEAAIRKQPKGKENKTR